MDTFIVCRATRDVAQEIVAAYPTYQEAADLLHLLRAFINKETRYMIVKQTIPQEEKNAR